MKKILLGIVGVIMTVGLVSGAAYALFSDTVEVKGISIASGNADLQMKVGNSYEDSVDLTAFSSWTSGLYPGKADWGSFVLRNNSTSDIGLKLSMKLTAADGNWNSNNLKKVVEFYIADDSSKPSHAYTSWYTLEEWNAADRPFNVTLAQNEEKTFRIYYRVRTTYKDSGNPVGNEVAGKSVTGIKFLITGTQAL